MVFGVRFSGQKSSRSKRKGSVTTIGLDMRPSMKNAMTQA
jgi:hypothetical protein